MTQPKKKYRKHWWQLWRPLCEHFWRPAQVRFYPTRVCDYCRKQEIISEEDFYAQFGISFEAICERINKTIIKMRL